MNYPKTLFDFFRLVAFLEGISFILLVGIAVPLKHLFGYEGATMEIGMAHGVLFLLYAVCIIPVKEKMKWTFKQSLIAFIVSLLPFGTFVAEYRWFGKESDRTSV